MGLKNYLKNDATFDAMAGATLAGASAIGSLAFNALSPVDIDPALAMAVGGVGGALAGRSYRRRLAGDKPKGVSITDGDELAWVPESMSGGVQMGVGGIDPVKASQVSRVMTQPNIPLQTPNPHANTPTRVTNISHSSRYTDPPETGGYSDSKMMSRSSGYSSPGETAAGYYMRSKDDRSSINRISDQGMGASGWDYGEEGYNPVAGLTNFRRGVHPTATL